MGVKETGILTLEELRERGMYPSEERMKKGPVAVTECVEHIPCNPCETSCPFHAICVGENISNLPKLHEELCTGCGSCVAACSGLAIFVVDKSYSDKVGKVSFPYEYIHTYEKGDTVRAANRAGQYVCDGVITRILLTKKADHTPVVTLEVPLEYVDEVRSIFRERG